MPAPIYAICCSAALPRVALLPLCVLCVISATSAYSSIQPGVILLAPRFITGQSAVYTLDAEFTRRRAQRDDAPGTRLTQSADLTFVTVSAEPDGSAAVRATFERLLVRVETLGPDASSTTWEWRRAAEKPVTDGAGVPGLDEACSALVRSSIQLRIAADGSLRTIEGLERAYEALAASREKGGDDVTPILGVFSPGASVSFFEGFWSFGPGSGARVPRPAPGDRWKVTKSAPLFGGYQAEATTSYTLDRVRADAAEISGLVTFAIVPPRADPGPADPAPKIIEQSGRIEATWDTAARRVVRRLSERSLAWSATISLSEPVEVKDYTTARVEIKLAPPDGP